jgi:putative transposase
LPANIRSDNGVPFASAHALFNLSKLAVWWLRLGIGVERIKPAILSKMAVMSACISL